MKKNRVAYDLGYMLFTIGVVFVVLRLTHTIDWSWWWVLLPFYFGYLLLLVILVAAAIVLFIMRLWDSRSKASRAQRQERIARVVMNDALEDFARQYKAQRSHLN